ANAISCSTLSGPGTISTSGAVSVGTYISTGGAAIIGGNASCSSLTVSAGGSFGSVLSAQNAYISNAITSVSLATSGTISG
ncbi:hypothetical protein, partial [Staphylococcus aureus]|uniref:hypothetical protein n=1 Tax=Staphylococcus aureus TaxID=1280 RepID=UPI001E2F2716